MNAYATAKHIGAGTLARDFALMAAGSLLLILSAKVSIPFYPVPLTMQTLVAIGLGLALGSVRGAGAVLIYLAEGLAGLPVFANSPERGIGLAYLLGPTGGYLIGFAVQAFVAGWLARHGWGRSALSAVAASLIAGAMIYPSGLLWLGAVIGYDKPLLAVGLYPFILGDLLKAALAALIFGYAFKARRPAERA